MNDVGRNVRLDAGQRIKYSVYEELNCLEPNRTKWESLLRFAMYAEALRIMKDGYVHRHF